MTVSQKIIKRGVISIDLDEIWLYHQIHGLTSIDDTVAGPMMQKALPRFIQFMCDMKIPATLFIVGKELMKPKNQKLMKDIADNTSHEFASHSMNHPYRFHLLPHKEKDLEIKKSVEAIATITKQKVIGFRAPGYQISAETIGILQENGFLYDASLLPSLPYYFARRAILLWYAMRNKKSHSHKGDIKNFYHNSQPKQYSGSFWQFPIATFPYSRIPCIGTTLSLMPRKIVHQMCLHAFKNNDYFDIEFHAIDFIDVSKDDIDPLLLSFQKELKKSLEQRLENFSLIINEFKKHFEIATLSEHISSMKV